MMNPFKRDMLFTCLILICCTIFYDCRNNSEHNIFPEQAYYLNSEQILSLAKQAKQGNGNAAYKLYLYYDFFEEHEYERAIYWLKIGANSEHSLSQYSLATVYESEGNTKEAEVWYRKAAKSGNKKAIDALKDLEK